MKDNVLLSIIIPAFNAERYIEGCLTTINKEVHSTPSLKNSVEVIVVDDCSSDNTFQIARTAKSCLKDIDISIERHCVNKQQGAARNTGLKAANGKYVWFVDVDDLLNDQSLIGLSDFILHSDADIIQFHAMSMAMDGQTFTEDYHRDNLGPMTGIQYLEYEAKLKYTNRIRASWSKLLRRDFLINNSLYFQEGVYWEDVVHTLRCFIFAHQVIYVPLIAYVYMQTPNSDMRGAQNGRKFADTIRFCAESCKVLIQNNVSQIIIDSMKPYYNKVLLKYAKNLKSLPQEELECFINILQSIDLDYIEPCLGTDSHNWLKRKNEIVTCWKGGASV